MGMRVGQFVRAKVQRENDMFIPLLSERNAEKTNRRHWLFPWNRTFLHLNELLVGCYCCYCSVFFKIFETILFCVPAAPRYGKIIPYQCVPVQSLVNSNGNVSEAGSLRVIVSVVNCARTSVLEYSL